MKDNVEYLERHAIKPSLQRLAVLEYLQQHKTHPTVDEIYLSLSPSIPTLSKTTVYNTLTLFAKAGVIIELTIDDKNLRYDVDITPHAHIRCENCGKIWDIPLPDVNLLKMISNNEFVIKHTDLYIRGVCKVCVEQREC